MPGEQQSADVGTMSDGKREYLTPYEAARLLQVSPKTVSRWAKEGRVPHLMTLGGHRRYPKREIEALVRSLRDAGGFVSPVDGGSAAG